MRSYVHSEKYQVNYNKNIGLINFLKNQKIYNKVINILKTELWMYFVFFLIIKVL